MNIFLAREINCINFYIYIKIQNFLCFNFISNFIDLFGYARDEVIGKTSPEP